MKRIISWSGAFLLLSLYTDAQERTAFVPGEVWNDSDGHPIQAHGGGILYHDSVWYWYGENKDAPNNSGRDGKLTRRVDVIGVSCYSSQNLYQWKHEGIVLPSEKNDPTHDLQPSGVLERPKVIYNEHTRKFVMLMHIDKADYRYARIGFAVADNPIGPFRYLYSTRPGGSDARDMTVFKDDDGKAYLFYSSEENKTMHVMQLTPDYLGFTGDVHRIFEGRSREAPAVFKNNGKYYMVTSGCTGWEPNAAEYAIADQIMGGWLPMGNPCIGEGKETTFQSQGTYIVQIPDRQGHFIFMADRWKPYNLRDSRYSWLPLEVSSEGRVQIQWKAHWRLPE